ncbi:ECF transporter S component [Butyrivibrio sp. X503]|uniref:ECF transporter S component n=1 Tax=Butyrivibrio sp. X503 TaxID=2364878 RepID=UPI000EA96026|nr:ECF transporter S component [Butyrivibrio sp. X503]RKM58306.1 ECF transporter S component [Butyrivibrio sp. X503]
MQNTSSLSRETKASEGLSTKTLYLVETALMIAVTLIMGNTFLGTIPTPFLKVSIVTVPVALAAMLIGPTAGVVCGLVFGLNSFFTALTGESGLLSTLFNVNPVGVFLTAVLARFLDAFIVSNLFQVLKKSPLGKASYFITGLLMPLFNTVFFMGLLCIFFYHSDFIQELAATKNATGPLSFVIALVGVQATVEAVIGCVLAGTLGLVLSKVLHRA